MADNDAYGRKVQPIYDALTSGNFKVRRCMQPFVNFVCCDRSRADVRTGNNKMMLYLILTGSSEVGNGSAV